MKGFKTNRSESKITNKWLEAGAWQIGDKGEKHSATLHLKAGSWNGFWTIFWGDLLWLPILQITGNALMIPKKSGSWIQSTHLILEWWYRWIRILQQIGMNSTSEIVSFTILSINSSGDFGWILGESCDRPHLIRPTRGWREAMTSPCHLSLVAQMQWINYRITWMSLTLTMFF